MNTLPSTLQSLLVKKPRPRVCAVQSIRRGRRRSMAREKLVAAALLVAVVVGMAALGVGANVDAKYCEAKCYPFCLRIPKFTNPRVCKDACATYCSLPPELQDGPPEWTHAAGHEEGGHH